MQETTARFNSAYVLAAILLATGIALAGYFIGNAFLNSRLHGRSVTVKGLSERQVTADFAVWPIPIKATGDNLHEVNNKIKSDCNTVIDFLIKQGFKQEEIEINNYLVTDLLAQAYRENVSKEFRYIMSATLILKTSKVELVRKATQLQHVLVQQGIVLGGDGYTGPSYEFTKFNDIKPEMLTEAIRNSRKSADKFAEDSGSKLGGLKNANQGTVLISPADTSEDDYSGAQAAKKSVHKKIRLVTTLEYYLKD